MSIDIYSGYDGEEMSERKKLVKKLDIAFSKYIRARDYIKFNGMCPFCHTHPIEQCFHFFSRVSHATRWREDNAIGSCAGCNLTMEHSPAKFILWYQDHYGREKLEYLDALWHSSVKYSNFDLELMTKEFIDKFNNLPEK